MYRKNLWCYVFILTLLDISLNTKRKLTAQGKSHGVTVQDSLIVTFQEWGGENGGEMGEVGDMGEMAELEGGSAGAVRLRPAALRFGRAALAAAHARTVTLTNAANTTLHLASVAGTTPDFHASFFEAKTLPPQGNTTFNVVYLGRREGPVSAHLYIHTSLGVHKYPVSAVGVASEYDVWPLVGVRVPLNASVEPELTLYNPTDRTIQVSEVYSSGAWLGLRLPGGGARAARALWAVPPRRRRALVRLRLAPPAHHHHPLTAYIRIKADIPGGGLVVAVEARGAAAGEHARPLQLRMRARGSRDPAHTMEIEVANSAGLPVRLEAGVRGARCWPAAPPAAPPDAPPDAPPAEPCAAAVPPDTKRANGGGSTGAHVKLLRSQLDPYQDFTKVAELTLNYAELWAGAAAGGAVGGAGEAWCAGCVRLGRAALPYSVRLLPGALALHPDRLHFVTAERAEALRTRELRATNEFAQPLRIDALLLPADARDHFHVEELTPLVLAAGASGAVARVRLRARALDAGYAADAAAALRTNLSDYTLPLKVYSGRFTIEWEWPNATSTSLELGALGAGAALEVRARLRNAGPGALCLLELGAALPHGDAAFVLDPPHSDPNAVTNGTTLCVESGGWAGARLSVSAAEAAGELRGEAWARSPHARAAAALRVRALPGRLAPRPLQLPPAAPYAWSSAELVLENSMPLSMEVVAVSLAGGGAALRWARGARRVARGGPQRVPSAVGTVTFAPERACAPHCYTGLDIDEPDGQSWLRRSDDDETQMLNEDLALLLERLLQYERQAAEPKNISLLVRTTEVVQVSGAGSVRMRWPRLAGARAGGAGAAAAGGAAALRLLLRNPARAPLLLHALLPHAAPAATHHVPPLAGGDSMFCERSRERCVWAADAFSLGEWRVTRGRAARWAGPGGAAAGAGGAGAGRARNGSSLPMLLLQPDAEIELKITFAPTRPAALTTYLYLRNNLTILEGVQLWGQGAVASFEIGGRRPGSTSPLLFEVSECGEGGAALVRRALTVRNTGRVAVRLRDWRLAGRPCAARGFRLQPCAPLHLAPNDSRVLHLTYAADYTLARARAALRLRSELGIAEFMLSATTPGKLLARCAAGARPPWDAPVRGGAWILSIAAFGIVLVAGVIDAERMMRHLHAVRASSPPPRPPLDLRGLANDPAAAPPAPSPRAPPPRRRRPRRPAPPLDPHAERRAFERWRAEVLRRADDDESRSSEDAEVEARRPRRTSLDDRKRDRLADPPDVEPRPESPSPPLEEYELETDAGPPRTSGEEDSGSSGSDASTPVDERDETEVEPYEAENEATTREPSPVRPDEPPPEPACRREPFAATVESHPRVVRPRRERAESLRRSERARADSETSHSRNGQLTTKHHGRRDKNSKRRTAAPPTPVSASPGPGAPENVAESSVDSTTGGEAESAAARGAVRWGASWSSVVGGGAGAAPLAPIGSDVRRREPERAPPDNSLFYFNSDAPSAPPLAASLAAPLATPLSTPLVAPLAAPLATTARASDPDFAWGTAASTDRSSFVTGSHDYLPDNSTIGGDAFGSLGGVWGGGAGAWPWSSFGAATPLRPPPGFGAPRAAVRPYDPFRSLASIWAPGAADWRPAAAPRDPRPRPDDN